ncbi:plantaricin C family lantibiotic [Paenibacillus sp. NPDC056722]|uniref:plantaricin C family lantibiotic n=1 Tax=Paenibacillus sp. NPDC056722 TaxID=3345924 RepID=UPI0036CDB5C5
MEERLYSLAGDLSEEMEEISMKAVRGGAEQRGISKGNDGKYCTLTWECSICPTLTCWC